MMVDITPALRCGCIATITFSSAVIRLNSRMFWNVRASPIAARRCGLTPVMSLPSRKTVPDVTLYSPVITLKNVVLPAPFGPIRLTTDLGGMVNETSSTATSPPNWMVMWSA